MSTYEDYKVEMQKIADVGKAMSVLSWDQQTQMPKGGAASRSRQMATLSGIHYEMNTSKNLADLVQKLSQDDSLSDLEKRNIANSKKDIDRLQKLNKEFVERASKATSAAYQAWVKARAANDFSLFEKELAVLIDLKKEEAEMIGYTDHPYDALLDEYEPGATCAMLDTLFTDVKAQMVDFVKSISQQGEVRDDFLFRNYDHQKQWDFGIDILKNMGYDFNHGRQDLSAHPFTTNFSPEDVRVTTRVNEKDFGEMTWSCIHEGGHALYEQGLPMSSYGLPSGSAVSLGIHESQSRVWENNIGRSLPYWKHFFPKLKGVFSESLADVSAEEFYKGINSVKPSFIRTNADELTYHFHILVRYEIEKALMEGNLEAKDIPKAWNEKYKSYLGIDVHNDSEGCLQDVHWAYGSLGYFPTYSLGSFYAAQFYAQAKKDIPGLEEQIANGDTSAFLDWSRKTIHQHGRNYTAEELCERITGEGLNFSHFMEYAREKYAGIYGFAVEGSLA